LAEVALLFEQPEKMITEKPIVAILNK
jgi:hypothetical protein